LAEACESILPRLRWSSG